MVFIKDYIVPILALSERELNETVMMLINTIGQSKFSFLTPDGEIRTLGHFVEDEVTKLTFSNSTHKMTAQKILGLRATYRDWETDRKSVV